MSLLTATSSHLLFRSNPLISPLCCFSLSQSMNHRLSNITYEFRSDPRAQSPNSTPPASDIADCGGAEYARTNGIPVLVFPKVQSDGLTPKELVDVLRKYGVDFVLLAGYLKLIPVELVQAFPKRILNIHPALLPAFGGKGLYGMRVHRAVLASGARYSGPTIHFVDEEYDTGRILAQSAVRVIVNDTPEDLAKRVLHEEHKLYVEVVAAICEDRIKWREDGVPLIQSREDPDEYY